MKVSAAKLGLAPVRTEYTVASSLRGLFAFDFPGWIEDGAPTSEGRVAAKKTRAVNRTRIMDAFGLSVEFGRIVEARRQLCSETWSALTC